MATMTLEALVAQLQGVHGDRLRAVVLYGSAAAPGHAAGTSDYNVLVLVEALDLSQLGAQAAATVAAWREAGHPPPLVMTVEEWRRSADIFPIEYADILAQHRVLVGALPTDGIAVRPEDLRLQLEHEAMAKLLQLRAGIVAASGDPKAATALVGRTASALVTLCRALLRLHGRTPPADAADVVWASAALAGFEADPVLEAVRIRRGARGDAAAVLPGFLAAATALVRHLDTYETPTPGAA